MTTENIPSVYGVLIGIVFILITAIGVVWMVCRHNKNRTARMNNRVNPIG